MRTDRKFAARFILGALVFCCCASGQTTFATITGVVTDPNGAVVPGVAITATHARSNYVYTAKSNEVGNYTLPQLLEGGYVVRAKIAGFKESVVRDVQLVAQDLRRIDLRLEIGSLEATIEVTAGATLIETETARISDSRSAQALKTLPLNTRGLWDFLGLTPGIVQAGAGSSTRRFAGSRANQSDASVDGVSSSNLNDGTQISPLVSYIESFQEMRVDMANNTAEFGAIGQVTIISKSGSNELHGSAFDYYSTPWFRARNPFAQARGTGISHSPGFSVGGPAYLPKVYDGRNKSFFFSSFETSRGSAVRDLLNPTVPLAPWRAGDFSALSTVVRDPSARNAPFAGNRIPAARLNPVSLKVQERFYPLPNYGDTSVLQSQNYREQVSRPRDPSTYFTVRGDHRFSDKAFVFGRYTWNRSHSRGFEGNLPAIGQRWQTRDTRNATLSYTQSIRPTLINELRWGRTFNDNPRHGPLMGKQIVQELGLTGLVDNLPDINGLPAFSFSGIGLTGISQQVWRHPGFLNLVYQVQDHVSWFRGRHSAKVGVTLTRVDLSDNNMPGALFGSASFSNRFAGHPYADFLLGIPTTSSRAAPSILYTRRRWAYDFFATDDFKLNSRLTLNLGVRYEVHPSWTDVAGGRLSVFDIGSGKIVVPDGSLNKVSPLMPRGYVEVVEASQAGLPGSTLLKTDRNNFVPRIGVAYRPWGNNTVFRAGYGLFFDVVAENTSTGGAPFVINEPSFTNPADAPAVILPRMFPASVGGPSTISLPSAVRPDIRTPYSMQYNLTIEHQRWDTGFRLSYIGTNTRQGEWRYNINQPLADTR
ncbi:MAG: TonB-dependent receptor, partial [Acidobacteria bacterium]|nr:TonB-dependent receptor [Acidobacteriota bacterium]